MLGKQQPCFVGAGELLREAFALQCGDPWLCSRCCVSVLACRAPRAWASCLQPAARVVLSPRHLGGRRVCVLPAAADGTGCLEGRIAIRYDTRGWRGALKPRHVAAPLQPPVSGLRKVLPSNPWREHSSRRRGGPILGPMIPNESSFRCRCIRHGRVALIPGHSADLNFSMILCSILHIRFEPPHDSWPDNSQHRSAPQCPPSPALPSPQV